MRRKCVAGNWKMNLTLTEADALTGSILEGLMPDDEVIIAVPFPFLDRLQMIVSEHQGIIIAAQNVSEHEHGAYTGEVSADQLRSIGITTCIIGHSERRQLYNETNEVITSKLMQAINSGLRVILCCGESLDQRDNGTHTQFVIDQLQHHLNQLDEVKLERLMIAYEPIWAIGTGRTASPFQAQEMHLAIRHFLADIYDTDKAKEIPILYGGSVNEGNCVALFQENDINGALVGGASLKADSFLKIMAAGRS